MLLRCRVFSGPSRTWGKLGKRQATLLKKCALYIIRRKLVGSHKVWPSLPSRHIVQLISWLRLAGKSGCECWVVLNTATLSRPACCDGMLVDFVHAIISQFSLTHDWPVLHLAAVLQVLSSVHSVLSTRCQLVQIN